MSLNQLTIDSHVAWKEQVVLLCIIVGLLLPLVGLAAQILRTRGGRSVVNRLVGVGVVAFYALLALLCVIGQLLQNDLPMEWIVYLVPIGTVLGLLEILPLASMLRRLQGHMFTRSMRRK